jgi:hypothetical protein
MPIMRALRNLASRWGAACLLMLGIFVISAQPGSALPRFGWADALVKKTGHALGYGLLALAYWRGLGGGRGRAHEAWGLAVLYSLTDEFHQAFVPGRHPSFLDVILFDSTGAAIALWLKYRTRLDRPKP